MSGFCPGVIFMFAIFSLNFVSIVGVLLFLALNVFRISKLLIEILASGVSLIGLNASRFELCIFLADFPCIAMQVVSSSVSCPTSATSAMSEVANFAAAIRFRFASVEARSIDLCEYVIAIGLFRFLMK
jgi:hypothetical protein